LHLKYQLILLLYVHSFLLSSNLFFFWNLYLTISQSLFQKYYEIIARLFTGKNCKLSLSMIECCHCLPWPAVRGDHTQQELMKMKKMKLFRDKEFYSKLWNLALPIALQNLMLALVAAADALMLGRVDQNTMSAVSLATQIQFIQNMVLGSIVSGIVVLGAQYWGKGDKKTINDLFCMGLRLAG